MFMIFPLCSVFCGNGEQEFKPLGTQLLACMRGERREGDKKKRGEKEAGRKERRRVHRPQQGADGGQFVPRCPAQ